MKDAPKGWPRISSAAFYRDASRMIDWLCVAYGFEVRLKVDYTEGDDKVRTDYSLLYDRDDKGRRDSAIAKEFVGQRLAHSRGVVEVRGERQFLEAVEPLVGDLWMGVFEPVEVEAERQLAVRRSHHHREEASHHQRE